MLSWENELYTDKVRHREIHSGASGNRVNFFMMNNFCYIMDGVNYLVFDGETIKEVEPYIPTIAVSKEPAGGGFSFEDFNLLGPGFKDSFSGDGTATEYILSLSGLDSTPLTAVVDGVSKSETIDFTVDRTTGKVTFATAPPKGTNNVIITAYKTQAGFPDRIKKCRFHTTFGGSNDTRIFLSGNPDMPNYVWRLGLFDPTYAPENGFYKFNDNVMGFSKQYDYLVIERENGKHQVTYELDSNGVATFPSKPINDSVGTIAPDSVQIIENSPVSLSKKGIYMLTSSNVRDERNVTLISEAVNSRLMREPNLDKAVSVDFDNKYWLSVNGNVYVFDYVVGEWFLYDNIPAAGFLEFSGYLYFGSSEEGIIYYFKKEDDPKPYNDDEQPIKAHWKSKQLTFGADEMKKLVEKVFFGLKPAARSSADIYYNSDKKESDIVKVSRMDMLDFNDVDFSNFSFLMTQFPQESMVKVKAKKITHFQLVIKNENIDESLGVLSVGIKYRYQSEVK